MDGRGGGTTYLLSLTAYGTAAIYLELKWGRKTSWQSTDMRDHILAPSLRVANNIVTVTTLKYA